MRASAILSIIALAAAAPSFAAPITGSSSYAKRQSQDVSTDESGAISLGAISTIAGFAAPVINGIINHFRGKDKREIEEMLTREFHDQFTRDVAATGTTDQSGAFLGFLLRAIPSFISLFSNNKREFNEVFARELHEEFLRELNSTATAASSVDPSSGEQSSAFLGFLLRAIPSFISLFSNHKRDVDDVFARELQEQFVRELLTRDTTSASVSPTDDQSGAFLGFLLRAIPSIFSLFSNHKRELEDILAREVDESDAFSLGAAANVASIGSSIVSVFHSLFGGNQQQRREFEELLARGQQEIDESGAISFGTLANIGSLIGSGVSVLHNLFSGNNKREFEELLARELEGDSGAVSLGNVANIASIGSSLVSVFHSLFGGNQQQRREFEELLARGQQEIDESGAISFGTLANIGSLIGSGVSVLHNLFSGNNKREFEDLLARHLAAGAGFGDYSTGSAGIGGYPGRIGLAGGRLGNLKGGFPHIARSLNELD